MAASALFLLASLLIVLMVLAKPLGGFIACLAENRLPEPVLTVERCLWKLAGVDNSEMNWRQYLLIDAATRKPDLVILDLGLPDGDGTDFIREFRQWSNAPVLVLSARSEEQDKITALDNGADDYLCKPFGMGEFLARLRVLQRRLCQSAPANTVFRFSQVTVDLAARVVKKQGEHIHLTPIEFRLLAVLLNNQGKVLTRFQLLSQVWGPNAVESNHYLRIYMGHLRQKLEQDPARPRHLLTESGIGYRFIVQD